MPLLTEFAGIGLTNYGFGRGVAGGNALELISTAYGTGSSGTITFSSIPQTFKHLQIRSSVAITADGYQLTANFNSDTGSNYNAHYLYGDGSSVASFAGSPGNLIAAYNNGIRSPMALITDILDYTNTNKNKTVRSSYGYVGSSVKEIGLGSMLWRNNSAITSLSLVLTGSTFTTATRFSLYGVA